MKDWPKPSVLIAEPDALRGLDHLIERSRRVLDRYIRMPLPVRKPDPKPLARTA